MPSTSQQQQGGKQGGQGGAQDSSNQTPPRRLQRSDAKVDRNQAQVGALLRTSAKRDLLSDTKDERESWLQSQKDVVVKDLVDAAVKKLTDSLGAKMSKVVAGQKAQILDDLDRNSMGWLPMREYLEFEHVWALRDYEGFIGDVKARFPQPKAAQ